MMDGDLYDVAIVGFGPVGATAANFLGDQGLNVVVLERDPSPYPRARAISTDEEVLRTWQWVGLAERLKDDMLGDRPIDFVDSKGRSFMSFAPKTRGNGHPPQMFIHQPALESTIRAGVERYPNVDLRLEREVGKVAQRADHVELEVAYLRDGSTAVVNARYVIACDGGSSPIRTQLDLGFEGRTYEDPWLVIDTKVRKPWPEVDHLRFHCDPARPAVDCPTPLGHHRWEFPVFPGEDREQLASEESVWGLLARHGIGPEHVELLRRVVYSHHVRFADRWRIGRILLAGDAAHVMPPWIGQGMASGVRDIGNLAWKLGAVIRGEASEELLDSYEVERQPHVRVLTSRAVFFGRVITERSRFKAALRNHVFRAALRIPALGRYVRAGDWLPQTRFPAGFLADQPKSRARGVLVAQPLLEHTSGERSRLDDEIGYRWAVVTLPGHAGGDLDAWTRAGARVIGLTAGKAAGGRLRDVDGLLTRWMSDHKLTAMVLRPDRIAYATAERGEPLPAPPATLKLDRKAVHA